MLGLGAVCFLFFLEGGGGLGFLGSGFRVWGLLGFKD